VSLTVKVLVCKAKVKFKRDEPDEFQISLREDFGDKKYPMENISDWIVLKRGLLEKHQNPTHPIETTSCREYRVGGRAYKLGVQQREELYRQCCLEKPQD